MLELARKHKKLAEKYFTFEYLMKFMKKYRPDLYYIAQNKEVSSWLLRNISELRKFILGE